MSLYGILISVSIWVVVVKTEKLAKLLKIQSNFIWDLTLVTVVTGFIGARVYHVLSALPYYLNNPIQILAIWNGGLGIYGAFIGGFLGIILFCRYKKEPTTMYLDLFAINIPLGQALGRIGNYVNQELYGSPTNLPWKLYITPDHRIKGYENINYYHPLFAYEALANIVLFILLNYLFTKHQNKAGTGIFFKMYIAGYAFTRFWLEFLRIDNWHIYGINTAQLISVLIICSVILSHVIYSKRSRGI